MIFALAAVLAIPFAAPPAVSAQTLPEPGTLTVTPFLPGSVGIGDPAPDDSPGLGAAVTYDWRSNLSFEGEVGHLFDVAGDTADIDWSVSTYTASALYHFATRHVTPYAAFGIGIERSNFEIKNPDPLALLIDFSATEVAFNFGGGVKYTLADRWSVRADLRRFQAMDVAPDFWRLYAGVGWQINRQ